MSQRVYARSGLLLPSGVEVTDLEVVGCFSKNCTFVYEIEQQKHGTKWGVFEDKPHHFTEDVIRSSNSYCIASTFNGVIFQNHGSARDYAAYLNTECRGFATGQVHPQWGDYDYDGTPRELFYVIAGQGSAISRTNTFDDMAFAYESKMFTSFQFAAAWIKTIRNHPNCEEPVLVNPIKAPRKRVRKSSSTSIPAVSLGTSPPSFIVCEGTINLGQLLQAKLSQDSPTRPTNDTRSKENTMSLTKSTLLTHLASAAGGVSEDEYSILTRMPANFRETLDKKRKEAQLKANEELADSVLEMMKINKDTIMSKVHTIRDYRKFIADAKANIIRREAAEAFGNEKNDWYILANLTGHISIGEVPKASSEAFEEFLKTFKSATASAAEVKKEAPAA